MPAMTDATTRDCSTQRYTSSSEKLRAHHGRCIASSAQPAIASEALADGVPRRCVFPHQVTTGSLWQLDQPWSAFVYRADRER